MDPSAFGIRVRIQLDRIPQLVRDSRITVHRHLYTRAARAKRRRIVSMGVQALSGEEEAGSEDAQGDDLLLAASKVSVAAAALSEHASQARPSWGAMVHGGGRLG